MDRSLDDGFLIKPELISLHAAMSGRLIDPDHSMSSAAMRRSTFVRLHQATSDARKLGLQSLARAFGDQMLQLERLPPIDNGRCRLLELPAEVRELIWIYAVTEWTTATVPLDAAPGRIRSILRQAPIRIDRLNRPLPPALTCTSHQIRFETLHLYYQNNIFECWRPLFWLHDWSQSSFVDWLTTLGPEKTQWLEQIVLLYKHDSELEHDIYYELTEHDFFLRPCVISNRQELSEYETSFEQLGLPRHFGKKRRMDHWLARSAAVG